ncbi:MAG: hypothetical protein AB1631_09925 [Acidobacteriota bacterium]
MPIDWRHVKTLLAVYFKQDLRSGKAAMRPDKNKYIRTNWALLMLVGTYSVMGLIVGMIAFTGADVLFYSILALSFTLIVVALAIVIESGNVLFNESEADVIGHLPVGSRTIFLAKVINLFAFTLLLAIPANLFPTICGIAAARSGWLFIPAHLISSASMAVFASTLIVTVYGLLMRYVSREKFDNIITYCQVGLAMVFIVGYQVMPRLVEKYQFGANTQLHWYLFMLPPTWFAGLTMFLMGEITALTALLSLISILAIVVFSLIALRKVAAGYSSQMSDISADRPKQTTAGERLKSKNKTGLRGAIKAALLRRAAERAVFDLVLVYLKRNRETRVRLYPSLAYFIIFPFIALITEGLPDPFLPVDETVERSLSFYSIMGPAFICFIGQTAVEGLIFSEHYNAAYIFRITPLSHLGEIHRAMRKAILSLIALPQFIILFALYAALWRDPLHAFLIIAPWIAISPATLMVSFAFREVIPLSTRYQKGQQTSRNLMIVISAFIATIFLGGAQWAAIKGHLPYWLILTSAPVASILIYFLLRAISRESQPLPPVDEQSADG